VLQCVAVCCSVLQCVAVCCSVWQCVAVCGSVWHPSSSNRHSQKSAVKFAVCCSVLQSVAVCCSVLQCVAVCYGVLQCVAVCGIPLRQTNILRSQLYCHLDSKYQLYRHYVRKSELSSLYSIITLSNISECFQIIENMYVYIPHICIHRTDIHIHHICICSPIEFRYPHISNYRSLFQKSQTKETIFCNRDLHFPHIPVFAYIHQLSSGTHISHLCIYRTGVYTYLIRIHIGLMYPLYLYT